jgi:hypothetical protein
MAYTCRDEQKRVTLTSFSEFKTRCLGISLMYLGISETLTSIGTFKWRRLRVKLESSLRSIKKGFLHYLNVEAIQLIDSSELMRRLKTKIFRASVGIINP